MTTSWPLSVLDALPLRKNCCFCLNNRNNYRLYITDGCTIDSDWLSVTIYIFHPIEVDEKKRLWSTGRKGLVSSPAFEFFKLPAIISFFRSPEISSRTELITFICDLGNSLSRIMSRKASVRSLELSAINFIPFLLPPNENREIPLNVCTGK